ncbi:hypothetical protein AB6A40_011004 [Gnathostoma spinigerum]|uniref:Chloride channel protein n=1 Tax=Gnathostoma spinigerum TaxID=75299 RepID=A0ABD6EXW5_9BILA
MNPHVSAGTITAYYQTKFPNEVFLVEELPIFALIGVLSGLFGAFFVLIHRRIEYCRRTNRIFRRIFGKNPLIFTIVMAVFIGAATFPNGLGKYFAGKLTFGQTLADFISNCSLSQLNHSDRGCPPEMIERWTGESQSPLSPLLSLSLYFVFYYFVVAICVSLAVPAGIFVPSFVIGACGGRILGELMAILYPDGIRGPGAPQIFPGLYAVVGESLTVMFYARLCDVSEKIGGA